jgi:hypothetical protein
MPQSRTPQQMRDQNENDEIDQYDRSNQGP